MIHNNTFIFKNIQLLYVSGITDWYIIRKYVNCCCMQQLHAYVEERGIIPCRMNMRSEHNCHTES